jgi:hypothetical protein
VRLIRPLQSVLSAGDGFIDRVLCAAGAVLCSQLPEFIQQYLQRLGGHLDEARRQLGQFREIAAKSGLTFDQFVEKSRGASEATVAQFGQLMQDTVARVDALASADAAIRDASILSRPFVFLSRVDFSIARATAGVFKPAVPTTVEGLMYAIAGMLLVMALYHWAVRYPIRRAWSRRAERAGSRKDDPGDPPVKDPPSV